MSSPESHEQPQLHYGNDELQSLHQRQQQQQQQRRPGGLERKGSTSHAAQVIASRAAEQSKSEIDLDSDCQNGRTEDPVNVSSQLAACSDQSERAGNFAHLQAMGHHSRLDLESDEERAVTGDSSRAFLEGLRSRSPSQRCSPEAAAHVQHMLTGQCICLNDYALT